MACSDSTTIYSYELNTDPLGSPRINLQKPEAATLVSQFNMTQALADAVAKKGSDDSPTDLFDFVGTTGTDTTGNSSGRYGVKRFQFKFQIKFEFENEQRARAVAAPLRPARRAAPAAPPPISPDAVSEFTIQFLAQYWEYFTLTDDERLPGKINLNTASRTVLETIPNLEPTVADSIYNDRVTNGDLLGVGDLLSRNIVTEDQFQQVAPYVTVQSHVFRIVSTGQTPSGLRSTLTAVVDRGGDRPVVLDWRESP